MLKIAKKILALATAATMLSGIQLPLRAGAAALTSQQYVLSDNDLQQSDLTWYMNNSDIRLNRLVTGAECYLKESTQGNNGLGQHTERLTDGYVINNIEHAAWGWYASPGETATFIIDLKKVYNISRADIFIGRNAGSVGADSIDFTVDVKTSNDLKTFTDYSSNTQAYSKDSVMKQIVLNPGTVQARYVSVTVSGGPQVLLGEILIFGSEIKEQLYLLSDNAVQSTDITYYAQNMGMALEKLHTGSDYEITSNKTDGVAGNTKITDGYVTSNNQHAAWGSYYGETAKITYDLKKVYTVGRVDVFLGTTYGTATGAKFSAVVKAGNSEADMTAVAEDTNILFSNINEMCALSFNTGSIDAQYVSVEITSNKQMLLGEVLVFGKERISPDGYLLSDNAIQSSDITYYAKNFGMRLDNAIETGAGYEVTSNKSDGLTGVTKLRITDGYVESSNQHAAWGSYNGESAAVSFDLKNCYDIDRIDIFLGENKTLAAITDNALDSIVIKAGADKSNLTTVKQIDNIMFSKNQSMRALSFAIDDVNAQYVEVSVTANKQMLLGEILIFGDSASEKLQRALKNADKYTNYIPYTETSWNNMVQARVAAEQADNSTDAEKSAAADSLNKAVNSLSLRGGDKILSQNDMWEADWQHFKNYDGIVREYLPNASAEFLDGTDSNIASRGEGTSKTAINYLFDGYSTGSDGNSGLWSSWGSPKPSIILYDLGEACYVNGVDVASYFYNGGKIIGDYDVETSVDGAAYTKIGTKQTIINENAEIHGYDNAKDGWLYSNYSFPAAKARYVKITIRPRAGALQYVLKEVFIRGIKDDSNKIIMTCDGNTVHAKLALDGEEDTANMFLAVYGNDGSVKSVFTTGDRQLSDGKAFLSLDAVTEEGDSVKAMTFDSCEGIRPITPYSELTRFTESEFTVSDIFGNNAVFQRDVSLPVFGTASTGTVVTVTLDGKQYSTEADENGDWLVYADPIAYEKDKTYTMTVSAGDETKTFSNMLAGDVWLCSGQSNMFWKLKDCDNKETNIASANDYPNVRYYDMTITGAETPQKSVGGEWKIPSSQYAGEFSAAAFLTARKLYDDLQVPIGVIAAARGGTSIEGFISRDGFRNTNIERYYTKLDRSLYFNGMINPIIPYGIKGVLWYQGCQNHAPNDSVYLDEEIALVNDWRSRWGDEDMPFIVTELAPCDGYSGFPSIRAQQLALRDKLDNIGVVCIMDAGPSAADKTSLHPTDKNTLADRLALCAEGVAYGMNVQYLFPAPVSCAVGTDGSVTVTYKDVYDGLKVKDGETTIAGFELVQGGKVYSASAEITGTDTVIVTASGVTAPEEIRYGYTPYPYPALNLYNSANLVATPFRIVLDK